MTAHCNFRANSYSLKTKLTGLLSLLLMAAGAQSTGSFINFYRAMGTYSTQHTDVFSFLANPASLSQIKHSSAGISAGRKYLLNELSEYTLAATIKTGPGAFGLVAHYTGDALSNRLHAGIGYARKLGAKADIGLQMNYNSTRIAAGYGSFSYPDVSAGLIMHLTPQLHAGYFIGGITGGQVRKQQEVAVGPSSSIGLGYEPSTYLLFTASVSKTGDSPAGITAGFQYRPVKQLLLRLGHSSLTSSWYTGAGFLRRNIRIDVFACYHPQLGITPGMSLILSKGAQSE